MTEKTIFGTVFLLVLTSCNYLLAQQIDPEAEVAVRIMRQFGRAGVVAPQKAANEKKLVSASLKTDPELEAILEKLSDFVRKNNMVSRPSSGNPCLNVVVMHCIHPTARSIFRCHSRLKLYWPVCQLRKG